MKLALRWFVPIMLVAMGLAWVSEQVALLLGFNPPPQDLVKIFTDPNMAWHVKARFAVLAVIFAPVVEELIFRMGLFNLCRWIGRKLTGGKLTAAFPWASALISGFVFAAVHFHAATLVPLWFLGVAFAWLYWKGGTIRASMLCHFLFNLVNLSLCLALSLFPEG